jgi:hypothetical protein
VDAKARHHFSSNCHLLRAALALCGCSVVGARLWAWLLFVVTSAIGIFEAPWDWHGVVPFGFSLLTLGFLLFPGTLAHVGIAAKR